MALVLDVDCASLPAEEQRGWVLAEQTYALYAHKEPLAVILDRAVTECRKRNIRYPAVVLKRLKQLQREEWSPPMTVTEMPLRHLVTCPDCGFSNDTVAPEAWLRSHPCLRPHKAMPMKLRKEVRA